MKTPITSGTFVALAFSVALGYAAPQRSQPAQPQTPSRPGTGAPPGATSPGVGSERNNRQQSTTLTGCLQQGSLPRTYVLVQSPGSSVPNGGVGTAGGRDSHGTRYDLVLDSKTDASKMVGRQVQVMGSEVITPVNSGSSARSTGSSATGTDRSRPNTSGVDKDAQRPHTADQPALGGGTGERERSPGDAGLTRFTVTSIKETGSGC
jgi:hypothetical protein